MRRLDQREIDDLLALAARGGIGEATALTDCIAEGPDQLMYIQGDTITLLRDTGDEFLGYCEGEVGWVKRVNIAYGAFASSSNFSSPKSTSAETGPERDSPETLQDRGLGATAPTAPTPRTPPAIAAAKRAAENSRFSGPFELESGFPSPATLNDMKMPVSPHLDVDNTFSPLRHGSEPPRRTTPPAPVDPTHARAASDASSAYSSNSEPIGGFVAGGGSQSPTMNGDHSPVVADEPSPSTVNSSVLVEEPASAYSGHVWRSNSPPAVRNVAGRTGYATTTAPRRQSVQVQASVYGEQSADVGYMEEVQEGGESESDAGESSSPPVRPPRRRPVPLSLCSQGGHSSNSHGSTLLAADSPVPQTPRSLDTFGGDGLRSRELLISPERILRTSQLGVEELDEPEELVSPPRRRDDARLPYLYSPVLSMVQVEESPRSRITEAAITDSPCASPDGDHYPGETRSPSRDTSEEAMLNTPQGSTIGVFPSFNAAGGLAAPLVIEDREVLAKPKTVNHEYSPPKAHSLLQESPTSTSSHFSTDSRAIRANQRDEFYALGHSPLITVLEQSQSEATLASATGSSGSLPLGSPGGQAFKKSSTPASDFSASSTSVHSALAPAAQITQARNSPPQPNIETLVDEPAPQSPGPERISLDASQSPRSERRRGRPVMGTIDSKLQAVITSPGGTAVNTSPGQLATFVQSPVANGAGRAPISWGAQAPGPAPLPFNSSNSPEKPAHRQLPSDTPALGQPFNFNRPPAPPSSDDHHTFDAYSKSAGQSFNSSPHLGESAHSTPDGPFRRFLPSNGRNTPDGRRKGSPQFSEEHHVQVVAKPLDAFDSPPRNLRDGPGGPFNLTPKPPSRLQNYADDGRSTPNSTPPYQRGTPSSVESGTPSSNTHRARSRSFSAAIAKTLGKHRKPSVDMPLPGPVVVEMQHNRPASPADFAYHKNNSASALVYQSTPMVHAQKKPPLAPALPSHLKKESSQTSISEYSTSSKGSVTAIHHVPLGSGDLPKPQMPFAQNSRARSNSRPALPPSFVQAGRSPKTDPTVKADGMEFVFVQPASSAGHNDAPSLQLDLDSSDLGFLSEDELAQNGLTPKASVSFRKDTRVATTDEWGFLRHCSPTPAIFRTRRNPQDLRSQEQRWFEISSKPLTYGQPVPKKVKRVLIEQGIPSAVRGRVWGWLMSNGISGRVPGLFGTLLSDEPGLYDDQIDRDIQMVYSDHVVFAGPGSQGQKDLRTLLRAYTLFAPSGYRTEHAQIGGAMLIHAPLEDAFWLMAGLFNSILKTYYVKDRAAFKVDLHVFAGILAGSEPKLAALFRDVGVAPQDYLKTWWMNLFIRSLPWPTVMRFLDAVITEGPRFLLIASLAILTLSRDRLLALPRNNVAVLQYLHHLPQDSLLLPDNFLRACDQVKLRDEDLKKMRKSVKERLAGQ